MKFLASLSLSLFLGLTACGANTESSDLAHHDTKPADLYSFSVDARPVDGNFQNLIVQKNEAGSYNATLHVITAGFGFPVSNTTEVIGENLDCVQVKSRRGRVLKKLTCSLDLRPADGELVELTVIRNEYGSYDATVHKNRYSTLISPEFDEVKEIAFNLELDR